VLSDTQIDRYSRQILLPEVGARGQARLLEARVAVTGTGPAAALAVTLLGRAGLGTLDVAAELVATADVAPDCRLRPGAGDGPAADVVLDLANQAAETTSLGRRAQVAGRPFVVGQQWGGHATVALLVGRPCIVCLPPTVLAPAGVPAAGRVGVAVALALGAWAASEALRVLLCSPRQGRLHLLAPSEGVFHAGALTASGACALCGEGS